MKRVCVIGQKQVRHVDKLNRDTQKYDENNLMNNQKKSMTDHARMRKGQ